MPEHKDTIAWAKRIGASLRNRRKGLGLSLADLSRLSGSTVPTLSHIERGTRDVKLSTLVSLAAALRIELSTLFINGETTEAKQRSLPGHVGYDLDDD